MVISVLTLFPEIFELIKFSILGRAAKKGLLKVKPINIRDFANDKHKSVDDKPYGGGPGMVMRVDVIDKAIEAAKRAETAAGNVLVAALDPAGRQFDQATAKRYSQLDHLILICGHYEGIDQRVLEFLAEEVVSIGPYTLSGGELAAMAVIDATARLIPGVLGNSESLQVETHENGPEYPQYTRPADYKGNKVPEVLMSGNHKEIEKWRAQNKKRF